MSTLYRPVLIESVEQAERLPQNALLFGGHLDDPWDVTTFFRDPDEGCPAAMLDALTAGVRVTALVPVEAEEELVERRRLCQKDPDVLHRYVTGWQHYTAKEQNR